MGKTVAQVQAEWITHGNIARLERSLEREIDKGRRAWLEGLLKKQRALVTLNYL